MILGHGGYGRVIKPPRNDKLIPKEYRSNEDYVQRITHQTKTQIDAGEYARQIFDPKGVMSSPLMAIVPRPHHRYSEILPYRQGSLLELLDKHFYTGDLNLFWKSMKSMLKIFKGMERLHNHNWTHHDIKPENMLYDEKPRFKLYMIDWGTALPCNGVYDIEYRDWHTSGNPNLPPEYKSFAHYKYGTLLKNNDFAMEFAGNYHFHTMRQINPKYMSELRSAHRVLQKEFSRNSNDFLCKIAPKADVFALGMVICQIYIFFARDRQQMPLVIQLIKNMITPNPLKRWDMHKATTFLEKILLTKSKI